MYYELYDKTLLSIGNVHKITKFSQFRADMRSWKKGALWLSSVPTEGGGGRWGRLPPPPPLLTSNKEKKKL